MSRTEDRPTDAGAEGVCWTRHRHDACVDSIVGMNRQDHLSFLQVRHAATEGDMIQCLFRSIKRVRVTRNTTNWHTSTHARVGALLPMSSCLGIGEHTGGSRQGHPRYTHGTPVPTQWEGRGWLRARPQAGRNE